MPGCNSQMEPQKIHIEKITAIKFLVDGPQEFVVEKIQGFNITSEVRLGFNIESKLAKAVLNFKITTDSKNENTEETICQLLYDFFFRIENLDELACQEEDKSITLKDGIGGVLAGLAYSTLRGILIEKLAHTPLKDFILPVIDPTTLLIEQK